MGYLTSKYPATSHTFILREVLALRERGISLATASINSVPNRDTLTLEEQRECDRTFYIKGTRLAGVLGATLWALLTRPAGMVRGMITAFRIGGLNLRKLIFCFFYLAEAVLVARWASRHELRHLHVHFATECATVALLVTKLVPITLSITVHGPDEFYNVKHYALAEKIDAADFLVCISFFAQSQLMMLATPTFLEKCEISRLGVDTEHFAPTPRAAADQPMFNLLCVGRLVPTKGQVTLVRAVKRLLVTNPNVVLTLVGDGPDRAALERLVSELHLSQHVRFAGAVNQDHIRAYYGAADAFVLASFAEGIPVVLMEAMAMEIPCIATAINGIPELISHEVNGLLVPPSDIDGTANAMKLLIDNPDKRKLMARAGRQRVQDAYELSGSVDRLAEIFHRRLGVQR